MSVASDPNPTIPLTFEADAGATLQDLRPALARILEQIKPRVHRAAELRRLLNLDQKLSWSVYNAATTADPRELASLLPGRRAMARFFDAAAVHGVSESTVQQARLAFERFEEAVSRHSRGRDAFEAMVQELSGSSDHAGADNKHKLQMFRSSSLLWGRQARVFCAAMALAPSTTPGVLDRIVVRGMVGLHRTRRGVSLVAAVHNWQKFDSGDPRSNLTFEPLDPPENAADSPCLLRDFCSKPLPEVREYTARDGYRCHVLDHENIGLSSEVTWFAGDILRACATPPTGAAGSELTFTKVVDTPIETYIGDMLLHKSIWDTTPPKIEIYAVATDGAFKFREIDLLPMAEHAVYLGEGIDVVRTPLVPRYTEMLAFAMKRVGWNPADFNVFRCLVKYPVLYTQIHMVFRKPGAAS